MMRTAAGLFLSLLAAAACAADDPFIGTWRFDVARSTIADNPGITFKEFNFAPTADGVLITETLEAVADHGARHVSRFPYAYNRATPIAAPSFDTLFVVKADDRTALWTELEKGSVVAQLEVTVSSDDRQMTFRYLWNAADPTGKAYHDRYVYVRP